MAIPIKSLFPPIEKKPFLLNKQKVGAVARRRVSTYRFMYFYYILLSIYIMFFFVFQLKKSLYKTKYFQLKKCFSIIF
jgi:hypothetical protein